MSTLIEPGKTYRCRMGTPVLILGRQPCNDFPWLAEVESLGVTAYRECGSWSFFGIKSPLDLILGESENG